MCYCCHTHTHAHSLCCRDMQFQPEPGKGRQRPYAEREKPRGAFGDLYPQVVPSAPESQAVATKG